MKRKKKSKEFFIGVLVGSLVLGFSGGILGSFIDRMYINDLSKSRIKFIDTNSEEATILAVSQVIPSVVDIVITKDIATIGNRTGPNIFPFDDFFEFPFDLELPSGEDSSQFRRQQVGGGSGFIISADGMIITNKHVVDDDNAEFKVILNDGREFPGIILGVDPFNDIAVLKIDATGLPAVTLGNSDELTIGQSVIAIGNSLGEYQNTVTKGVVSGINRRVLAGGLGNFELIDEAIQTDAAINPGNSGGPLVNLSGEVIGVNTAISRAGQLIGFAIPINSVRNVVESVLEFGRIIRPWLGVRYVATTGTPNTEIEYGALLLSGDTDEEPAILPGSPAERAGLLEGDIILEVAGERITEKNHLGKLITTHKPGNTITLKILREDKEIEVEIVLSEYGS